MAYYAWDSAHEPVQAVTPSPGSVPSGIGAYFAWDSAHEPVVPVNGLGTTGESKLADEAMRALIDGRRPLMVAGEWAIQDSDIVWRDTPKEAALTLIPITDQDLNRARRGAFGAETPAVGVLRKTPALLANQELAFAGTPFAVSLSLAVYSLSDAARVALPYFLTIASLRDLDDADRGTQSVAHAARQLGGTLVYIVSLPKPPSARNPGAPFQAVFQTLAQRRAIGADAAPVPLPSAPAVVPAPPSDLGLVPYFVGGLAAAGGVWWLLSRGRS